MSIRKIFLFLPTAFLAPSLTYAAAGDAGSATIQTLVEAFNASIVNSLVTLFIAVAATAFFYGGLRYVWGIRNGDEAKLKEGNQFLIWGGIALFVMVSMWGIIAVLQSTIGFSSTTIKIPNANMNFIGSSSNTSESGTGGTVSNDEDNEDESSGDEEEVDEDDGSVELEGDEDDDWLDDDSDEVDGLPDGGDDEE